jgi:hypothetical protein
LIIDHCNLTNIHLRWFNVLTAQVSALVTVADGSIIQPSITKLHRLAQLRLGGHRARVRQFPPGFGDLSALTYLALRKEREARCCAANDENEK